MKHATAYVSTTGHAHCREGSLRRLAIHESASEAQQLPRQTKITSQKRDCSVTAITDTDVCSIGRCVEESTSSAGETTEHLREETVVVPDPADRATIEEEHALELRTRDRERKLLKKIEQSIGRIDSGDYGYCDETGEPIGVGRLIARPTANLSLEAQQRRELKQKMFGD